MFQLHERLNADTHHVCDMALCRVLLMNDSRYTWLILVPMIDGAVEITDLSEDEQLTLMQEIASASKALQAIKTPDKINIGALGNLVPQLHIHVMARFTDDPAWPGSVWGHSAAVAYDDPYTLVETLKEHLIS